MNDAFARGLRRSLTLSIAIGLIVVTAAAVMILYIARIRNITQDGSYVFHETLGVLDSPSVRGHSVHEMAEAIAVRVYHPGLEVTLSRGGDAYDVRWDDGAHAAGRLHRIVSDPEELLPFSLRTMPVNERVWFYLARMSGYSGTSAHVGNTQVLVQADRSLLSRVAQELIVATLLEIVFWLVIANLAAGRLTERALAPLAMVLQALEASAAGDLESRVAETNRKDELGRLAVAYNDAIETVSQALTERGRAERKMRQFIADAGHHLQTPLTVIRGYIGILRKGELRSPDDIPRILEKMERQSDLMAALIQKLMLLQAWENDESMPAEPVDVGALVAQIVTPIADANPERDIRIHVQENTWARVAADELTFAVSNLVDNALKYGRRRPVAVTVAQVERAIFLAVTDQGDGLTEEEVKRVFDRFYRGARRDVPGSGLGLAIARRAAERALGTLTVQSMPGVGSQFTISLPAESPLPSDELSVTALPANDDASHHDALHPGAQIGAVHSRTRNVRHRNDRSRRI